MFIKTQDGTIVNMNKVFFTTVSKHQKLDMGELNLHMDGFCIQAYKGTIEDAEYAFNTLEEALIKGATFISYSKEDIEKAHREVGFYQDYKKYDIKSRLNDLKTEV